MRFYLGTGAFGSYVFDCDQKGRMLLTTTECNYVCQSQVSNTKKRFLVLAGEFMYIYIVRTNKFST